MRLALAILFVLAAPATAQPARVSGQPFVVDGDSLRFPSIEVRLEGIDAPEWDQVCHRASQPYRCGLEAKDALLALIASRPVDCHPMPQPNGGVTDRYGRTVAICFVGGVNINAWMVENGHAIAYRRYSTLFVDHEERARAARRGMHAGTFQAPWDYRRERTGR